MSDQPNYQIIIAERGWVYVGRVARDGDMIVISQCQNIRRWGTSRGLGELAAKGPRGDTLLDPYGTVRIHVLAVCGSIDCSDEASKAFDKIWEESICTSVKKKAKS